MFNVGDKVVIPSGNQVYTVTETPFFKDELRRYSLLSSFNYQTVAREGLMRKATGVEEVRWHLETLGYEITGAGCGWISVDDKIVVEFDESHEIPFAIADVNGYQLSVSREVLQTVRSAVYYLEKK